MNFGSIGIQKTVDKIINNFCYTYDLHETEFRNSLRSLPRRKLLTLVTIMKMAKRGWKSCLRAYGALLQHRIRAINLQF